LLSYLQSGIQQLSDYPLPFWLALFVEGTRFTQAKLLAAKEYATSTGLPVPRNVLIPRTKVNYIYFLPFLLLLFLPWIGSYTVLICVSGHYSLANLSSIAVEIVLHFHCLLSG